MKKIIIFTILMLTSLLIFTYPIANAPLQIPIDPNSIPTNTISVNFLKEQHQSLGNNCYNVQVNLNVTNYFKFIFKVQMKNFYLFEVSNNLTVSNQPYWIQSNNTITMLLFPSNPIILQITFSNFCLITAPNIQVNIFYDNGNNSYQTKIFP